MASESEKAKERSRKYRKTPRGVAVQLYHHQVQSAKARGHLLPNYTREELEDWLIANPKFEPMFKAWLSSGCCKDLTPSVDRIDDNQTYSLSNIQLMTWGENNLKGREYYRHGRAKVRVDQLTLDGSYIKTFATTALAAEAVGCSRGEISRVCKGKRKTCRGYAWRYTDG